MWLTSFDLDPGWGPVEAELVRHVKIGHRTDWAWVDLKSSIHMESEAHTRVLVGARHLGDSIWSEPARWPIHVYVCRPKPGYQTLNKFTADQVSIAYWGLLHKSRECAEVDTF